jgi:hypothetical protein
MPNRYDRVCRCEQRLAIYPLGKTMTYHQYRYHIAVRTEAARTARAQEAFTLKSWRQLQTASSEQHVTGLNTSWQDLTRRDRT